MRPRVPLLSAGGAAAACGCPVRPTEPLGAIDGYPAPLRAALQSHVGARRERLLRWLGTKVPSCRGTVVRRVHEDVTGGAPQRWVVVKFQPTQKPAQGVKCLCISTMPMMQHAEDTREGGSTYLRLMISPERRLTPALAGSRCRSTGSACRRINEASKSCDELKSSPAFIAHPGPAGKVLQPRVALCEKPRRLKCIILGGGSVSRIC